MRKYYYLFIAVAASVLLAACQSDENESDSVEPVSVVLEAPSVCEPLIAPGRALKVSGRLSGNVPDDAIVRVSLIDKQGREVRFAESHEKGCDRVITSWYKGPFLPLSPGKTFKEVAFTAPELVVADTVTMAGAKDATIKCVYTDSTFAALITSATDVAHGLPIDDFFNLVDQNGEPYTALPVGHYIVRAAVYDKCGRLCGKAETNLEIGIPQGVLVHEDNDLFVPWANEHNIAVLIDLLPGMIGKTYNFTCMGLSWAAEYAEYISAPIYIMNYHLYAGGVAQSCEIGNMLQAMGETDNTDRRYIYHYDIGEPWVGNRKGEMVRMDETKSKMVVCRIDEVTENAVNGVYQRDESQVVRSVFGEADGTWSVSASSPLAIMGVSAPYQLQADEVTPASNYGFVKLNNGLTTIHYTITGADGTQELRLPSGVLRPGTPVDRTANSNTRSIRGNAVASYEFYNVLPAGTLKANQSYTIHLQGEDKNGNPIGKMAETLSVVAY